MIYKNTTGQKLAVFAYTASTGAAKTGDAAQITSYVSIDWGGAAAVTDTNPTELDATNMPGWYVFDLSQAETNGNVLVFAPKSSTSGVVLDQVQVFTTASVDQTGDSYARLGAPVGASVSADIAAIEAQTDDIGAAGAGLTGIPWNAAWDAEVESEVDDALGSGTGTALTGIPWNAAWDAEVESEATDALNAYDPPTNAEMEARTIASASYALQSSVDDLEGRLTATRAGYLDNLSAGAVALEATAQSILADTGTDIPASLTIIDDFLDTEVAAILADTNELQGDWVNGGRLDLLVDAIKAKTDNLPSDPADQSAVEAAITAATSPLATAVSVAALNNLSAAQVNAEVVDALTVDVIADSVASDGSRPTIAQALLEITRFLMERSVSSTTLTVKKEDGSTSSMTFTLNDATSPTAITRAS